MKRLILCLAMVLMVAAPAWAGKTYTVSVNQFVEHPALDAVLKGFQDGMKELGIAVDYKVHIAQANMATTNQIASQIRGEEPDLVLAIATPSAQACAQKIKDRPILLTAVTDPVGAGLVQTMEKPGGNVSGMTDMSPVKRQIELAKEIMPSIKTMGVIYNAGEANSVTLVKLFQESCKALGIATEEATVVNSAGVYQAAKSLMGRADAVYIPTDNTVISALESALKVSYEAKLPIFPADTDSVKRGCVASLAVDYYRMGVQTASMAKRILVDGADVAAMPVEALEELEMVVNPTAAQKAGLTIPAAIVEKADAVIN